MDSIRKPSSFSESWQILFGRREGDPEQAQLMLDDPDRIAKQRVEAHSLQRLRKVRRPLGSAPRGR